MKIAIPACGGMLDSPVDEHVGRATFFVIYDTDDESHRALDNWRSPTYRHWAGPRAVDILVDAGANVLITQRCGPCAFRMLGERDIAVYYTEGSSVSSAIRCFREGGFVRADRPNCDGHAHLRGALIVD